MHVGQPVVAAAEAVGELFVVEAQEVQDGGVEVVDVDLVLQRVPAEFVGGSVDHAAADAPARHPHREAERMVLAAVVPFGRGSAAEFATPQDQGVFQQAAGFQVGEEGRNRLIDGLAALGEVFAEAAMLIPGVVGGGVKELHEPHPPLDQSTGQQALAAKEFGSRFAGSVKLVCCFALPGQIERFGGFPLHAKRQFERGDPGVELAVGLAALLVELVQAAEGIELGSLMVERSGLVGDIGNRILQISDEGTLVGTRQKAGSPKLGSLKHSRRTDHDKAGEVLVFRAKSVGEPRPQAGTGEGLLAGAHLERRPGVIDVVGMHRADDADVVDARGQARQQLADFDPGFAVAVEFPRRGKQIARFRPLKFRLFKRQRLAVIGRQSRFGIEQIDMRRSAGHIEKNHPLGFGCEVRLPNGIGIGGPIGQGIGLRLLMEQAGQGERSEPAARLGQNVSPRKCLGLIHPCTAIPSQSQSM